MSSKVKFVTSEKMNYPIRLICKVIGISESGYYAHKRREPSARAVSDREAHALIWEVHKDSRCSYGAPRVHAQLRLDGHRMSRKRVARLMKEAGLQGKTRQRRVSTTQADPSVKKYPGNIVNRNFETTAPGEIWLTDVTYLQTRDEFHYLAVILDLYGRRVLAWECSKRNDAELTVRTLRKANELVRKIGFVF